MVRDLQLVPNAHQSLSQLGGQRFRLTLSLYPFLVLASQIGIDARLVRKIVSDGAINLFQLEEFEILADRFWGFAAAKGMYYRIE
ncbi:MAG TPA: hypothetical protein VKG25_07205 [Bryobacteraceae bacterium]|nr:hypothetical protein [Bryobacteraceae bacterium]